jgi:4-alpha-glucanotransferase
MITDDVRHALRTLNLPGMKVLMFAFNENLDHNPYLPHNYEENCIVYSGTHDNNTARGWFRQDAMPHERENLARYANREINEGNVHWTMIDLALKSAARIAIVPVQDLLGLDEGARMNKPGTDSGNWRWRLASGQLPEDALAGLARLTNETGRS